MLTYAGPLSRRCLMVIGILTFCGCATAPPAPEPPLSTNPAVISLLDRAQLATDEERHGEAQASLERALRIEPANGRLWYALAQSAMRQEDFRQTESFALRADSFAGRDPLLKRDIWRLIATARESRGDETGASAARQRAKSY